MRHTFILVLVHAGLVACGGLETKSVLISVGDEKEHVLTKMGSPFYRQVKGENEAWQYCQTSAASGYPEYRLVWIQAGRVTGVNSYKSTRAGSSCGTDIRIVKWEDARSTLVETGLR